MATTAPKGYSRAELKLLNDFMTTLSAREINANTTITRLELKYSDAEGFSIILEETSNALPEDPVEPA